MVFLRLLCRCLYDLFGNQFRSILDNSVWAISNTISIVSIVKPRDSVLNLMKIIMTGTLFSPESPTLTHFVSGQTRNPYSWKYQAILCHQYCSPSSILLNPEHQTGLSSHPDCGAIELNWPLLSQQNPFSFFDVMALQSKLLFRTGKLNFTESARNPHLFSFYFFVCKEFQVGCGSQWMNFRYLVKKQHGL